MSAVYTEKQSALLHLWQEDKLHRINILDGSVRSGKTWISLVLWAFWVATMPRDANYLMTAKTLTALQRNCLDLLVQLVGRRNFSYSLPKKEGVLFGRRVYLEGVNDARSESKIRGLTLIGAYCDELTLFTEDFFAMLLSRLSMPGAKLFGTTNPDNPHHWLKKNYLDRADELDLLSMKFLIDDNTFLNADYVSNIKREYVGVFYERFILGKWKAADGVIYPQFADNNSDFITTEMPYIAFASIGVDFGGDKSANAFVCNGYTKGLKDVITLDEEYIKEGITPEKLYDRFIQFVLRLRAKGIPVYDAYCDSAESTLIHGLRAAANRAGLRIDIRKARKGPIIDRIRFYNVIMAQGRYKVMSHCKHLIEALSSAVWDEKKQEDTRLDDGNMNVDSLDALEYSSEPYMKDIISIGGLR